MSVAAPTGRPALVAAKWAAGQVLWGRTRIKRFVQDRRAVTPALPAPVKPTDVLSLRAEWERAIADCRRLGLPLHHDRPKNWDALGAVSVLLHERGRDIRVLDAGAARYSSVLPWLYLYGVERLIGNNLEFTRPHHRGPVRYEPGDITATGYGDASFDAITCMSVIEHGVPLEPFLAETARLLAPGGTLVVSTDYDREPPDTSGHQAYGVPVKIFGPEDIRRLVSLAAGKGLDLLGDLVLEHESRPIHWKRTGLDFTYIRLVFTKRL